MELEEDAIVVVDVVVEIRDEAQTLAGKPRDVLSTTGIGPRIEYYSDGRIAIECCLRLEWELQNVGAGEVWYCESRRKRRGGGLTLKQGCTSQSSAKTEMCGSKGLALYGKPAGTSKTFMTSPFRPGL